MNIYYQPIINLSNNKYLGVELFVKPFNYKEDIQNFMFILNELQNKNLLYSNLYYFINIHPINIKNFLNLEFPNLNNIVLEVTEYITELDYYMLNEFYLKIRSCGMKLALDDFGSGIANFCLIENVPFDFIKVDCILIRDIHKRSDKQLVLKGLQKFTKRNNIYLIAEKVETKEELNCLKNLGINYVQGFAVSNIFELDKLNSLLGGFSP